MQGRRLSLIIIALVSFIWLIRPCLAETKDLTIIFTGDTRGEIENCHCPKDDFGGLERRANYLKAVRKEDNEILLLDTGDVLPLSNPSVDKRFITYSAFISFKAMALMSYDAMNVGESDIILGEEFLKSKEQQLTFPLLSANIVNKDTAELYFKPYIIRTMKNGLKVGILGLVNERYIMNSKILSIGPNKDSALRYIEELKKGSDVIIVLGHLGIPYSIDLANSFKDIGVILSGHWDSESQEPMKINNSIIMPTSYHSRKIGRLDLQIEPGIKILSYKWDSVALDEKYDEKGGIIEQLVSKMPKGSSYTTPSLIKETISAEPLRVHVFYSASCLSCMEIRRDVLPEIERTYGDKINVEHYDIALAENYEQMIRFEKLYGVEAGYVPEIVVSRYILTGKEKIKRGLNKVIEKALYEKSNTKKNNILKSDVATYVAPSVDVDAVILSRFDSFSIYTVIAAGFLDGINPCAFTTIVFFISFLAFAGYKKREMILAGGFFMLAVFLAYLSIGLGIFRFLRTLNAFSYVALAIDILIGGIAFLLGGLNLIDYFRYRIKKDPKNLILQLPQSIKNRIHSVISSDFRPAGKNAKKALVKIGWVAFSAGFMVSILESLCTGQVYLPTIAYVLRIPHKHISAFSYLMVYNLVFIAPLLIVFLLGLFGVTSIRFAGFMERHLAAIKLLTALVFFTLGIALFLFK